MNWFYLVLLILAVALFTATIGSILERDAELFLGVFAATVALEVAFGTIMWLLYMAVRGIK